MPPLDFQSAETCQQKAEEANGRTMNQPIIKLMAYGPDGNGGYRLRENAILARRVMSWRQGDEPYGDYGQPFIIITMDSGTEYHAADELKAFELRLLEIL